MAGPPIIVGTDGSKQSLWAVEWAAHEAAARSARLQIVTAPPLPSRMSRHHLETEQDRVADVVRKTCAPVLISAAERAAALEPGLELETNLVAGSPGQTLAECAAGAAMLVVGSRGARMLPSLVPGSVSWHVVTHARCPVVVVREESTPARREVIAGIADLEQSARILDFAFQEAALRQAMLVVVHAWTWYLPSSERTAVMTPAERAALDPCYLSHDVVARLQDTLDRWRQKYPGVQAGAHIVYGHPGRELAGASVRADLVVLGRRPAAAAGPVMKSVTHAVLHHAHGPVAVIAGDSAPT
jgi:nucleotide-binding universal stress UspA family protein